MVFINRTSNRNKPHKCIAQSCFSTNAAMLSPNHTTSEKGGFGGLQNLRSGTPKCKWGTPLRPGGTTRVRPWCNISVMLISYVFSFLEQSKPFPIMIFFIYPFSHLICQVISAIAQEIWHHEELWYIQNLTLYPVMPFKIYTTYYLNI